LQLKRSLPKLLDYDFEVLLLCDGPTHGKLKIAEFEEARMNPKDFGFQPNQTGSGRERPYIRASNLSLDTRERSVILRSSEEELSERE
jgi:hypothetical protein